VSAVARREEALALLRRRAFDIVLAHLSFSKEGSAILQAALAANPMTCVIVMTGNPSVEGSIKAIASGAWEYLPKPFSASHLHVLVGRAAHTITLERATGNPANSGAAVDDSLMIGRSPAFRSALELARKVARTDASISITGESGSGKEVFAHYIHKMSKRANQAFVAINCAALPESLLESEMFGHVKGAFTGAVRDKPGLLEVADDGTLFLDELVEMPKASQSKLLRVIEDGIVRRVGSEDTRGVVDVRFISATNADPEAAIKRGELREDLYYRLRVVKIHVPPLRERPEDIELLRDHFLTTFWKRHRERGSPKPEFSEAAIRTLAEQPWNGNVRELQNVIENVAVLVEPGSVIQPDDLMLLSEKTAVSPPPRMPTPIDNVPVGEYHPAREQLLAQFETRYLTWLLNRSGGNMSEGARIAGVDRTTLYRLLERHGLQRLPYSGLVGMPTVGDSS
jgi:DNA-binding NtrC family response regulator